MTKLTDTQMTDLINLAKAHVEDAFDSVEQLIEDPEQTHLLEMAILVSMMGKAAEFIHEHVTLPNGEHPSIDLAYFKVLATLAKCGNMDALKQFVRGGFGK